MIYFRQALLMVGLAAFVVAQTGCYSYRRIGPGDVSEQSEIRVTDHDGRPENFRWPQLKADTIMGTPTSGGDPIAIPFRSVAKVESRSHSIGKTVALVAFPALAFASGAVVGPELLEDWDVGPF
jgi:hypothetical protein